MLVAFIENVLGIRGTQGNAWALAHFNETMLHNKSIIVARSLRTYRDADVSDESIRFFTDRFETHFIPDLAAIDTFLKKRGVEVAYTALAGGAADTDTHTPTTVPTIVHCVFCNYGTKGSVRAAISPYIWPPATVLPNIVYVDHAETGDLRNELGISHDAIVLGRYGGYNTFDVPFVVDHIKRCARARPHIFFLFMNTRDFTTEPMPNIMFLPPRRDVTYKTRFIRTCDAMLHARSDGETHGMACGEFALLNRPVITTRWGATAHIDVYLKNRAVVVHDADSLQTAIDSVKPHDNGTCAESTGYDECTPEKVMPVFRMLMNDAKAHFSTTLTLGGP